jgi:hypothetical protein
MDIAFSGRPSEIAVEPEFRIVDTRRSPRRSTRSVRHVSGALLFALASWASHAAADGADIGPTPADGTAASASIPSRAQKILAGAACGGELQFFLRAQAGTTTEDQLAAIVGKIGFVTAGAGEPCTGSGAISSAEFVGIYSNQDEADEPYRRNAAAANQDIQHYADGAWKELQKASALGLINARMGAFFGDACGQVITTLTPNADQSSVAFSYEVSPDCLLREVNAALSGMGNWGKWHDGQKERERPGSSDLPCNIFGLTVGEWDVKVRDFVRILDLDRDADGTILDDAVRQDVFSKLVTIRGKLGEASYSLLQCGDSESTSGSPQDGVEESGGGSDLGDVAGDAADWLLKRLAFLAALALAILAAATVIGGILGALAGAITIVAGGAAAAVLTAALTWGRIPESENHRLMIESSRYLANQWTLEHLGNADPGRFDEFQAELKDWLLERFQKILSSDFAEYNARPYQRYSIIAVLNIADFANDDDLRLAARMVLDYYTAKVAIGSYQERRLVPFRRLMEGVTNLTGRQDLGSSDWDAPCPPPRNLLCFGGGADYGLELMMLYTGGGDQLEPSGHLAANGVADMVYPATSGYRPESFVLDLALRKRTYLQAVHHSGYEIYSAGPGFLITAGGIETAATGELEFPPGTKPLELNLVELFRNTDRGAGLPTTLMLGASGTSDISKFIRIEGQVRLTGKNHFDKGSWLTYDGNLCVWSGFACGLNVQVPQDLDACAVAATADDGGIWRLIDSSACGDEYQAAPRVFVAVYRQCDSTDCTQNTGFLEVIPAAAADSFADFQERITAGNPSPRSKAYHSASGHDIAWGPSVLGFTPVYTVSAVDGAAQAPPDTWAFASGDVLNADGGGRVRLTNPAGGTLILDMSDRVHPNRRME